MIFWETGAGCSCCRSARSPALFLIVGFDSASVSDGPDALRRLSRRSRCSCRARSRLPSRRRRCFASCVVYGRLSHDNEVVALKAAGVHLYRIINNRRFLLGVLTTGVHRCAVPHHDPGDAAPTVRADSRGPGRGAVQPTSSRPLPAASQPALRDVRSRCSGEAPPRCRDQTAGGR